MGGPFVVVMAVVRPDFVVRIPVSVTGGNSGMTVYATGTVLRTHEPRAYL
jgi:hypothetical protein